MESHMLLADFPESASTWLDMGRQAGFEHADVLFMMPNRMGRVFKYWNQPRPSATGAGAPRRRGRAAARKAPPAG